MLSGSRPNSAVGGLQKEMDKAQLLRRDVVIKAVSSCGKFRVAATSLGTTLKNFHFPSPAASERSLIGHCLGFATLMASFFNAEERVVSTFVNQSMSITCESLALGEARGFIDVSTSMAEGQDDTLRVRRFLYNNASPVDSVVVSPPSTPFIDVVHHFFRQSEGMESAVLLLTDPSPPEGATGCCAGVLVSPTGPIESADVERLEVMRDTFRRISADEELTNALYERGTRDGVAMFDLVSCTLGSSAAAATLIEKCRHTSSSETFPGFEALKLPTFELNMNTVERTAVDYMCRCSKNDFVIGFRAAAEHWTEHLSSGKTIPVTCRYCRTSHEISAADLRESRGDYFCRAFFPRRLFRFDTCCLFLNRK